MEIWLCPSSSITTLGWTPCTSKSVAAVCRLFRGRNSRHTAATLLLVQGVHPRVVMELLGHSQISITMNTYSHVVPALRKEAADQMDAALTPVATRVATSAPEVKPT